MIGSLHGRLMLTATVIMAFFFLMAGFALNSAFSRSAEADVHEHLKAQMFGLLAIVELDDDGRVVTTEAIRNSRFAASKSGLFAWVADSERQVIWNSKSGLGVVLPDTLSVPMGTWWFAKQTAASDKEYYTLSFRVRWESNESASRSYTFVVAEDLIRYKRAVRSFRRRMTLWLVAATLVLLAVQTVVSRWTLAPLRRVANEIREVERGHKDALNADYPIEVSRLTDNINRFIRNERDHLQRYRHTLGDLAHSLKTPLAVLRGLFDSPNLPNNDTTEAREQVDRMTNIVDYQLRRAATSGRTTLAAPVEVEDNVSKLLASLHKVYADKAVAIDVALEPGLKFYGEEGDLLEMLGNLLDNAFRWCRGRIRLSGRALGQPRSSRGGVIFEIDDDGPGVPDSIHDAVAARRADGPSYQDGQGIGLAVVSDIVATYDGTLELLVSDMGGASVRIVITPA